MVRDLKERHGFVNELSDPAIVSLPVGGKPVQMDVTEPLKAACLSLVQPIIDAVRGLVSRFDPEFQHRLRQNIILGGGGSQLKGLDRVIESSLKEFGGAKVTRVSDATFAGAVGALKLAMNMPAAGWTALKAQSGSKKVTKFEKAAA
jgi:rod shape-determining protein MreB